MKYDCHQVTLGNEESTAALSKTILFKVGISDSAGLVSGFIEARVSLAEILQAGINVRIRHDGEYKRAALYYDVKESPGLFFLL